jgi:hypothetical protein
VFSPYVGKALLLDERVGERPRLSDVLTDLQENASLCECFPQVCPEPVLVKRSFSNVFKMAQKICVYRTCRTVAPKPLQRETLVRGAMVGMIHVHGIPSSRAWYASARA